MRSIDDEVYEELLRYRSYGTPEDYLKMQRLIEAYKQLTITKNKMISLQQQLIDEYEAKLIEKLTRRSDICL